MVGWHHQCNGHELGQTPGDGRGQGGLACCSPWGHKESDMTWRLNNKASSFYAVPCPITPVSQAPAFRQEQVLELEKCNSVSRGWQLLGGMQNGHVPTATISCPSTTDSSEQLLENCTNKGSKESSKESRQ